MLLSACGAAERVAGPPPTIATFVLATTNGRTPEVGICNATSCYQTIGDTIRLSSDSTASHVFTIRETLRANGQVHDSHGEYHGSYSVQGTVLHLVSGSFDRLTGTIDAAGLRLFGIYGDLYVYSRR